MVLVLFFHFQNFFFLLYFTTSTRPFFPFFFLLSFSDHFSLRGFLSLFLTPFTSSYLLSFLFSTFFSPLTPSSLYSSPFFFFRYFLYVCLSYVSLFISVILRLSAYPPLWLLTPSLFLFLSFSSWVLFFKGFFFSS